MRTSIATVSLSGSLTQKLHACAEAGFDGVEVFEPDLVASEQSPEEIRALATRPLPAFPRLRGCRRVAARG